MRQLIAQIRETIPFESVDPSVCNDECKGCSFKLLEYLNSEIEGWEYRISEGETPNFGDLNKLAKSAKKIHRVLEKNGNL